MGYQGDASMMPREASLSDGCMSDSCSFFSSKILRHVHYALVPPANGEQKSTTTLNFQSTVVRETGVSQYHEGLINDRTKIPRTITALWY